MTHRLPPIRVIADIEALEREPLESRSDIWNVYDLLAAGAALDPAKPAFLDLPNGNPDETPNEISYGDFLASVRQAANLFHRLGIGPTDSVAVLLPIVPDNYIAMFGAMTAGILCPINWLLSADQIASILSATGSKVLIALGPTPGYEIWQKVETLRPQVPTLEHVLRVDISGSEPANAPLFSDARAAETGDALNFSRKIDGDDIAVYAHTGGTTGMPKIAQLRNRAIAYKCWAYSVILAQESRHTVFAGSPLFHIGGLVYHTASALARGMTSLIVGPAGFRNKAIIENYWRLVERYGITDLFGVPTTLSALANVPLDGADISSLRPYTMTGSAGLPVEISRYLEREMGVRMLLNYGMTENTATITLPPRDGDPKFGSSGLRLPYTQIRIVEIDANDVITGDRGINEIGEIIIKGPGVIPGYLDPSLNDALFLDDGWLRTGDLGRLAEDQYLWVTGRAKDVIIRSGHNIDPIVIEEALMSHTAVALVGAVGRPDAYAGEMPIAFVQLKPGVNVSAEELLAHARDRVADRSAAPADVFLIEALPLTAVGKVFKPDLRRSATEHTFTALLREAVGEEIQLTVQLEPDPTHGTLLTVTTTGDADLRAAAEPKIRASLDAFAVHYRIA